MKVWPASRSPSAAWKPPQSPPRPPPARDRAALSADVQFSVPQSYMNQHMPAQPIAFIDVAEQRRLLGMRIDDAVSRVLTHCQFINGPEVAPLEAALARFSGARHVV